MVDSVMRSVVRYFKLVRDLWHGRMKRSSDRMQKANEKAEESVGAWYYKNKQLEALAMPLCQLGGVLELIKPVRMSFHTGDNNWMEDRMVPPGSVFLILESPEYNGESWLYEVKVHVLGEGRKALVNVAELAEAIREV